MERPTLGLSAFDGERSSKEDAKLPQANNLHLKWGKTKLGLWLFARTKSTNVAFAKTFSKIPRSSIDLSNKKKFLKNDAVKQKLQLMQFVVFPADIVRANVNFRNISSQKSKPPPTKSVVTSFW
jgi:hypothetical protein